MSDTLQFTAIDGITYVIDAKVSGNPPPETFCKYISGDVGVECPVYASSPTIMLINISRVDAGRYRITYANFVGVLNLILNLLIHFELTEYAHARTHIHTHVYIDYNFIFI